MRNKLILPFCIAVLLTSCEFSVSTKRDGSKEISSSESNGPTKGAIIRNDIELDAKDVKIKEAYLLDGSKNLLETNEVKLGEDVLCSVVFDTGWTKYDGKSYIGASEKIMTQEGVVVMDEPDLFKDYSESGVPAEKAKLLSVVATITKKQPNMDDYKVQFRMWDKKGSGEVTGSFKFKVK